MCQGCRRYSQVGGTHDVDRTLAMSMTQLDWPSEPTPITMDLANSKNTGIGHFLLEAQANVITNGSQ